MVVNQLVSRVPRFVRRGSIIAVAAAATGILAAGPASAYNLTGTTVAGAGLNVHQDLNGGAGPIHNGPVIAVIPYNSTVYIDCYWYDAPETGPWGTTSVWDDIEGYRTPDGNYHDLSAYNGDEFVTDAWVNTGGNSANQTGPCYGGGKPRRH
ncbi:MAG TPA: hypothetical protein VGS19_36270 [Streptosporangiaceae bacterium]|nr:hypothetical protein [Streptosporangiaceae bacterium]